MATTPDKNDSTDVEANKRRSQRLFFGTQENAILWSEKDGWDLSWQPIKIDTKRAALVIVDMQNNLLDDEFRSGYKISKGRDLASNALLQHAIPAARKLEAESIRPAQALEFMFGALRVSNQGETLGGQLENELAKQDNEVSGQTLSKSQKILIPDLDNVPGESREEIELADGSIFEPGRVMVKGTWNAALYKPFNDAYEQSKTTSCPDILIDRNRNCGLYGEGTTLGDSLRKEGIRTLLFAGNSAHVCASIGGHEAHVAGFDTIILRDGFIDGVAACRKSTLFNNSAFSFISTCSLLFEEANAKENGGKRYRRMVIESPEAKKSKEKPFGFDYPVPESWLDTEEEKRKSDKSDESDKNDISGRVWDESKKLPYSNISKKPSSCMIYRQDVINKMEDFFSKQEKGDELPPAKFALYGGAGVGKSYAALQFAMKQFNHSKVKTMLMISCESELSILEGFSACAKELELPSVRSEDHFYNTGLIQKWLLGNLGPWLVVFENVDDASLVKKYLPGSDPFAGLRFQNLWTIEEILEECMDHSEPPVKAIWDIAFNTLSKKERDILSISTFIPQEYIWKSFFVSADIKALTPGYPRVFFRVRSCGEFEKLVSLGLLQFPGNAPVSSMCKFVQTAFKEFMGLQERQEGFANAVALAFAHYPGSIPDVDPSSLEGGECYYVHSWWSDCITHLSTIMRLRDYFFEERKADPKFSTPSLFCGLLNLALGYLLKKNTYNDLLALAEDNTIAISTVRFSSNWTRVSTKGELALYKGQALVRTGRVKEGVRQFRIAQDIFFTAEPYCRLADAASCAERLAEAMLSIGNFTKAMQHYEQARSWRAQEHIGTSNGDSPKKSLLSFAWSRQICLFELRRGNEAEQMEVIWDLGTYLNSKSSSLLGLPEHIQRSIVPYANFALGKMYQSLGLLSSAELFLKQAMKNCFVKGKPANAEKYGFLDLEPLLASCLYRMACIALDQCNELTALRQLHNAKGITHRYKASMPVEYARVLLKLAEIEEMYGDPEDSDDSEDLFPKDLRDEAVKLLKSRVPSAKDVDSLKTYDDAVFILWR
ncbi:NB-ARC and TPR domain-containing protein [Penicillium herquei]|nr:NB-ARC and TPR domain-containing protein [Penicillium herquei]